MDILARFDSDLVGRLHGPLTLRFFLQPLMALVAATKDGVKDARDGKLPYFWRIFTSRANRKELVGEELRALARTFVFGAIIDSIYQIIVLRWIYPFELVAVVLALAFVRYLLWCGLANRLARWWMPKREHAR
jgi:hypothetical protein